MLLKLERLTFLNFYEIMYVITVLNKISKVWQPTYKGFAAHRLKNWSKCTTLEMNPVLYIFLDLRWLTKSR